MKKEADCQHLTFLVTNEAQRDWIATTLLHELESRFRIISSCSSVRLSVEAVQYEEKKVIYTPEDKARALMESTPEVLDLIKDFDLDVK